MAYQRFERSSAVRILLVGLLIGAGVCPAMAQEVEEEAPPFVPTSDAVMEVMLSVGRVGPGDMVYDLGSGDGRLVIAAAGRGARAVGVEYEGWLVERSRAAADSAGVSDRVRFVEGDIFETPFDDADVVMLYLSPEFNLRLRPRLLSEVKPGARVVSHAFHMGDWAPDTTVTLGTGAARATVFQWTVPADVSGFWSVEPAGMEPFRLELHQEFQQLTGTAAIDEREVRVEGVVIGDSVVVRTGNGGDQASFRARVVEGRLVGSLREGRGGSSRAARGLRFTDPALAPVIRPQRQPAP